MDEWTAKSDLYISSARDLHDRGEYHLVAHAAYYACLLLMQKVVRINPEMTEAEIEQSARTSGSHNFLINHVQYCLTKSENKETVLSAKDFSSRVRILKKLRTDSDYTTTTIFCGDSEKALSIANELIILLKRL